MSVNVDQYIHGKVMKSLWAACTGVDALSPWQPHRLRLSQVCLATAGDQGTQPSKTNSSEIYSKSVLRLARSVAPAWLNSNMTIWATEWICRWWMSHHIIAICQTPYLVTNATVAASSLFSFFCSHAENASFCISPDCKGTQCPLGIYLLCIRNTHCILQRFEGRGQTDSG